MPAKNGNPNENFAAALTEVSDRLTRLVQDEIELAKAEVAQKATSLARGAAAVAAGAVFGVFAVVFFLLTLAWVIDGIFVSGAGSLWLGFLVVLVVLLLLTAGAFMFAWKKLSVGAPTPKLAISEGKKIKDTVTAFGNGHEPHSPNGGSAGGPVRAQDYPANSFASVAAPAVAVGAVTEPTGAPGPVGPTAPAPVPTPPVVAAPEPPTAVSEPPAAELTGGTESAAGYQVESMSDEDHATDGEK